MNTLSACFSEPSQAKKAAGALLDQGVHKHQVLLLGGLQETLLSVKLPQGRHSQFRAILSRHGAADITLHEAR